MGRSIANRFLSFACGLMLVGVGLVSAQPAPKPFDLPTALPPGPSTWLLGQSYGNTIGAFLRGDDWYSAGQRLHFGIDLSMPCGTPLVAVADGEVMFVDDMGFGAGPHNLLLRHAEAERVTLYGHLLERPLLVPGQHVQRGEVVGLSGDPDGTCDSRPHLHFEVRALNYFTAYNPVDYIEANWHALAAIGSFSYPMFQQDLENARRWLSLDDQPPVAFGGAALNRYAAPHPDLRHGAAPQVAPPLRSVAPPPPDSVWQFQPIAFSGCCANATWHPSDPGRILLIDGTPNQRATALAWTPSADNPISVMGQAPMPRLSADGSHQLVTANGQTTIRRLADNTEWTVAAGGVPPALNLDNTRLLWQVASQVTLPGEAAPLVEIWTSAADGSNPRQITAQPRAAAYWLDAHRVLVSSRTGIRTTLIIFDLANDDAFVLGVWDWLRELTIAPGGGRLMLYTVYAEDPAANGIHTITTQTGAQQQTLPWFGAWRWRDADSVYYLPFDPSAPLHTLAYYHIPTGESRLLTDPATQPFQVANGDWAVSPDGQQVVFWNAADLTTWLLTPTGR
ncbi:MAG: M23 family metallopeptidase [Chloroflexi bacterium]|nr:M23 family metallopeptidase [Chloroflexota bacterium]